jgi:hypothetical protein
MLLPTVLAFVPLSIATFVPASRPSPSQASGFSGTPIHQAERIRNEVRSSGILAMISNAVHKNLEPTLKESKAIAKRVNPFTDRTVGVAPTRHRHAYKASPSHAMVMALRPGKLVKWCVVALFVSEALDRLGILENPQQLKDKLQRALKVARTTSVPQWKGKAGNWWGRTKQPGGLFYGWKRPREKLATWEPKHQSAVGGFIGLAFSQFFWSIASKVAVTSVAVYALSEANLYLKEQSGKSALDRLSSTGFPQVEVNLALVRDSVRASVKDPMSIPSQITDLLDQNIPDGGLPPQTKWGFLWGLGAGVLV